MRPFVRLVGMIAMLCGLTPQLVLAADRPPGPEPRVMTMLPQDLKWERIVPELGEKSPEITILRVDPNTKATQLMIRIPKNVHVPKHWHTANETHTILSGTFIVECEGKRDSLGAGAWNYIPHQTTHEAWTKPDEGTVLFITVDAAWDVNWTPGPPKPSDFIGGRTN
jgi:quercetin dioxygenase-like cupin family protein